MLHLTGFTSCKAVLLNPATRDFHTFAHDRIGVDGVRVSSKYGHVHGFTVDVNAEGNAIALVHEVRQEVDLDGEDLARYGFDVACGGVRFFEHRGSVFVLC